MDLLDSDLDSDFKPAAGDSLLLFPILKKSMIFLWNLKQNKAQGNGPISQAKISVKFVAFCFNRGDHEP